MIPRSDHAADVRKLVAVEPVEAGDRPATGGELQRLCRAARRDLPASGVGLSVLSRTGAMLPAAASSRDTELVEELQFGLGEGPCMAAFRSGAPVLVPDLGLAPATDWPAYATAAHEHGVRAVFAFPMQVGAARLGALDVYRDRTGELSPWELTRAHTYAQAALDTILAARQEAPGSTWLVTEDEDNPFEVYQAQGMLMAQLAVAADDALARMRAHSYARGRRLGDVARDIVARRLVLEPDDPHG